MDNASPVIPIALGLFSALTLALNNVAIKKGNDILTGRAVMSASAALLMFPATFFVPLPSSDLWLALFASSIVHFAYQCALIRTLHRGDLSAVFPIMRGSAPLLTAIGAFLFLGETLSPLAIVGLVIATLGVLWFGLASTPREEGAPWMSPAIFWAMMTALGVMAYNIVDARGVRLAQNPMSFIVWLFICDSFSINALAIVVKGRALPKEMLAHWKLGVAAGVFAILSYGAMLLAMRITEVAFASALRETAIVIAAVLGALWLKEPFGRRRIIAALFVASGLVMMQFWR